MKRGIKHRHLPGDISKREKIFLLESTRFTREEDQEPRRAQAYKKRILMKERAVLSERFRRALQRLDE